MLNRADLMRNIDTLDMLIRALAAQKTEMRRQGPTADQSPDEIQVQMEEALYGLRLKKLLLTALN